MIRKLALVLILVAPLAACDSGKEGTSISINTTDADGNMIAGVDGKTGQVSLNVPGFSGKIKMPKIKLDADNFDMNGVHLYPGSTISGMNIDAKDGAGGDEDSGTVKVSFSSPATPDTVRGWFLEKLNSGAKFNVKASGSGLTGTTDEGKPFTLNLSPDGAAKSKGTIVLGS
ncbi:hypothetical protein [Sphingomonas sp. Leaf357]|uniref:hypothetical protein n=1 Tax=Sphingomonas sp. Leaf357 TaxID=1736350 RepID=UPI000B27572D|nr:hypothetical protein [Sphingomonas sp. Leaf357]